MPSLDKEPLIEAHLFYLTLYFFYITPVGIFAFFLINNISELTILLSLLLIYYVLITIFLIFFFRHLDKKKWHEKHNMQEHTDNFYKEYFKSKEK